jgi:hypothetical protein
MGLGSRFLFYSGFLQVLMLFPIICLSHRMFPLVISQEENITETSLEHTRQ